MTLIVQTNRKMHLSSCHSFLELPESKIIKKMTLNVMWRFPPGWVGPQGIVPLMSLARKWEESSGLMNPSFWWCYTNLVTGILHWMSRLDIWPEIIDPPPCWEELPWWHFGLEDGGRCWIVNWSCCSNQRNAKKVHPPRQQCLSSGAFLQVTCCICLI